MPAPYAKDVQVSSERSPFTVDVKRFHVPFSVACACPHCGVKHEGEHSGGDYLNYPQANALEWITWTCEPGCGKDFRVPIVLEISVRAATAEEIA